MKIRELRQVVEKFGAYVASMMNVLDHSIDTQSDLMYGCEDTYNYVSIPIRNLQDFALDKDSLDKLYSIMAFFVDNVMGEGNIYLTNREDKLVIEIAWS